MLFEYTFEGLHMKVLDESYAAKVLDFYERNRDDFDRYEPDKPSNFYTMEYVTALLKAEYNAALGGRYGRFFLYSDDISDTILGSVSFTSVPSSMHSCRIGYKVDRDYRHIGLATTMINRMIEMLTHEKEMHRIEAYIHPDNIPSLSLINKLQFIPEGTAHSLCKINGEWQDHLRYVYIS